MYWIAFEEANKLLTFTVEDFWTVEETIAFGRELLAAKAEARARHPDFSLLGDLLDFPVQSNEVTAAFTEILQGPEAGLDGGRMAIVTTSMLSKLQAQRVITTTDFSTFTTEAEARAWLAAPEQ